VVNFDPDQYAANDEYMFNAQMAILRSILEGHWIK